MTEQIILSSLNCQGLGGKDKRKDVLNFLKQKKYSIYCIQDTHFTEKEEKYIRTKWGYECFFSSFNSQSRGVAILLNNNFEYKLHRLKKDRDGNKLILDITIKDKRITLINIYGPNRDSPAFFDHIKDDIKEFDNELIIFTGDFNLTLNPEIDTKNYTGINNTKAMEKVQDLCAEFNIIDIWRELNMEKERYTWRTKNRSKQARLDFFLISEQLFIETVEADIEIGYRSDHSLITLKLKGYEKQKSSTFWKFNNSLLKDSEYIEIVKKVIRDVKQQYVINNETNVHIDDRQNTDLLFNISDQLFLETLLLEIRGKTISYSSFLKKQRNNKEKKLVEEITALEIELTPNNALLEEKRLELQEIRKKKIEGSVIRSRAKWIDQGEKTSRYFCNLENRNFISKCMPNLWKSNGEKTKTEKEIINETQSFYEHLYAFRPTEDIDLAETLPFPDIPKLNEDEKQKLDGVLKTEEVLCSLKNMKNNKSPGSDGFTAEFFKFFWQDIGTFVVRSINNSFQKGELPQTQKEGLITCIPKGQKDKQYLKNWRPISLLNVTYKLASACIANRIKTVLPKLINEDQTGFIKGRYIGENIRTLYDIFHYTEKFNIPGLLLLIDFEKAFDSVAWTFIYKVLNFFNFGPGIKKWLTVFYNDIKSCVIVNGQASQWFNISRGCRQGDPLSPYIFILCAEILALTIRKNKNIKGIMVGEKEFLNIQYADDTSLLLDATEKSLRYALLVLKFYAKASGLHINIEKTRVIWFGSMKGSNLKLCNELNLSWDQGPFTVLGIKFSTKLKEMIQINYTEKIREVKDLLIQWSKRILTPYGKIIVIKSLAMAKINHLILALPNPPEATIKEMNSIFFKFIWGGGTDRIKRSIVIKEYKQGGLKMINIEHFVQALKVTWIRRLIQKESKWSYLLNYMYPNISKFTCFGINFLKQKIREIQNSFWSDTFTAWVNFCSKITVNTWTDFLLQPIWYNYNVKVGGQCIFYKRWFNKGINFIYDLVDDKGHFCDFNFIKNIIGIQTTFVEYQGLIQAIRTEINKTNLAKEKQNILRPAMPVPLKIILYDNKGCQRIHRVFCRNNELPTAQKKWNNVLLLPETFQWHRVYTLPYKVTSDTNIRWFQYRLVQKILSTNSFLYKIGITQNNTCSFCKIDTETLTHLFWDCNVIKQFWHDIQNWLKGECVHINDLNLSKTDIIFGIDNQRRADAVINFIILLAKQFIYRMKYKNAVPLIQIFKKVLLLQYNVEKFLAYSNCNWTKFNQKWMPYKQMLNRISNV